MVPMTKPELVERLNKLCTHVDRIPEGADLKGNSLGNLGIFVDGKYIGFVNLRQFEVVIFEQRRGL